MTDQKLSGDDNFEEGAKVAKDVRFLLEHMVAGGEAPLVTSILTSLLTHLSFKEHSDNENENNGALQDAGFLSLFSSTFHSYLSLFGTRERLHSLMSGEWDDMTHTNKGINESAALHKEWLERLTLGSQLMVATRGQWYEGTVVQINSRSKRLSVEFTDPGTGEQEVVGLDQNSDENTIKPTENHMKELMRRMSSSSARVGMHTSAMGLVRARPSPSRITAMLVCPYYSVPRRKDQCLTCFV